MNILIICGSQRLKSQSLKVAQFIYYQLNKLSVEPDILELAQFDLPFAESRESQTQHFKDKWSQIANQLKKADGFVIISPEWGGMATPALKNLFLLSEDEFAHKPGLLVGVSASRGGAYPISDLRSSSYKNSHICYIPEQIIVRDCNSMLNDTDDDSNKDDFYLKNRIHYSLVILLEYANHLSQIRDLNIIDLDKYPNGM